MSQFDVTEESNGGSPEAAYNSALRPPPIPRISPLPTLDEKLGRELRIFVRPVRARQASFAKRLLRLETWGDTLLGSKVADELATAYLILLIVFLFEMLAWSLLFNFAFYGGKFDAGWLTPPAFGLGLLWGLGVLVIDKGLITSDLRRRGADKWFGFAGRLGLIAVSAIFTAQPLEQLFFRSLVEERLKEETVRTHAMTLKRGFDEENERQETKGKQRTVDFYVSSHLTEERDEAVKDKDRAIRALDSKEAELKASDAAKKRAVSERRELWNVVEELKAQGKYVDAVVAEERARRYADEVRRATDAVEQARTERDRAADELRRATEKVTHADRVYGGQLERAELQRREDLGAADERLERYRGLLARIQNAKFGERVLGLDDQPIGWNEDGVVERILVLDRLAEGLGPRWPFGVLDDQRKQVALWAGMPDLGDDAVAFDTAHSIRYPYWFLMFLAGTIPLLSIAFKFTMSDQLRIYYSAEAQANVGNAEALMHRHAQESSLRS